MITRTGPCRDLRLFALLALMTATASCATAGTALDATSGLHPDELAITELIREMERTVRSGDPERYRSLWAPDAAELPPFSPAREGRERITVYSGNGQRCDCEFVLQELEVVDDWAFARVHFAGEISRAGGLHRASFDDTSLLVLRRSDRSGWQLHTHLLVYDEPVHTVWEPGFELPEGVELRRGIVYARPGGYDLRLDLFTPRAPAAPVPGVVFVHGGSWFGGNPKDLWRQAGHLAAHGFAVATIEYRLSGVKRFPAAVQDAKSAVRWMRAHGLELGIREDRIGILGNSAGAQIAGMVATTSGVRVLEGDGGYAEHSSRVQAVAVIDPPLDLTEFGRRYPQPEIAHRALGFQLGASCAEHPALWAYASPLTHVSADDPPFLIIHGSGDPLTPPVQSMEMAQALRETGVDTELFTLEGGSHDSFQLPEWHERVLERIVRFFSSTLLQPGFPSQ